MDATDSAEVVCDAGPIIHLDELDALGLLAGWTPGFLTLSGARFYGIAPKRLATRP